MTDAPPPRNDAAMADILASIRRIVAEEDRRGQQANLFDAGDVLVLTPEMRLPDDAPEPAPAAPLGALSVDETVVAEIARAVLREEFEGPFGRNLTQKLRQMVRHEIGAALAERRPRPDDAPSA